jgi:two-component system nitrogen regulation sensor histidine kinase NtrY
VVISDVTRALREEERQAWQRLVRVLGHEINNSLAPIKSIAGSLQSYLDKVAPQGEWSDDFRRGLEVIASRSESLARFMGAYALLARLPRPSFRDVDVRSWVERMVRLETRRCVTVVPGPELTIRADGDQLDQLLINLIRNAVEASMETGGDVRVGWDADERMLEVWVEDEGPGLGETGNLFVPFFTTKPEGSGIGLALSRQIAEGHRGSLTLENRRDGPGCVARLVVPLHSGV